MFLLCNDLWYAVSRDMMIFPRKSLTLMLRRYLIVIPFYGFMLYMMSVILGFKISLM